MNIKYILSVIAIVAFTQNTFAQYSQDAFRFSQTTTGSTSRVKAVGNAGTALGGDLSNISGNPAGLGFFTRSEFSITPEFDASKSKSTYLGQNGNATRNSGNLNHAAVVIYNQLTRPAGADKNKGWLSVNYGVGYSRVNDFYQNINYGGQNNNNSINDFYSSQAKQYGYGQGTLAGWAYDHFLINPQLNSNALPGVEQTRVINTTGGQSAIDFSFGANYSNKLYLGLGLSFTDIRYNTSSAFFEDGTLASVTTGGSTTSPKYSSDFLQNQASRGTGFSARLGLIYKPVETVRLGATITTPTFYNIDDVYNEGLATRIGSGNNLADGSDDYRLNYNMRTPFRFAGGAAVFINHFGFITGDVEYVDYSTTHLSNNSEYNADRFDNPSIKNLYKSVVNVRVGAEARVNSMFLLRGGYGIQGDALKQNGSDIKTVSGGIGLRFGSYYVDATYAHSSGKQTVFPYDIGSTSPSALLKNSNDNAYLTLGYRF